MDILNERANTYICEACGNIVDLLTSAQWEFEQENSNVDIPCFCDDCQKEFIAEFIADEVIRTGVPVDEVINKYEEKSRQILLKSSN